MSGQEPWNAEAARAMLAEMTAMPGPALAMLQAVQARFGHVPAGAVALVADAANVSRAEVHGVVGFYHDFRRAPAGRHVVRQCRAEACQSVGADALADHAKARLGVDWHGTTKNGAVTLEPVFCLGLCACGPSALVDGEVVGRMDAAKFDAIVKKAGA